MNNLEKFPFWKCSIYETVILLFLVLLQVKHFDEEYWNGRLFVECSSQRLFLNVKLND